MVKERLIDRTKFKIFDCIPNMVQTNKPGNTKVIKLNNTNDTIQTK